MSSGIRKAERKSGGSAGMRVIGRGRPSQTGSSSRPNSQRPSSSHKAPGSTRNTAATATTADADIPLAAATGLAPAPEVRNSVEYTLVSTNLRRTHNVMRFFSSKPVDPETFTAPVKLRRRNKEYYRLKSKKRNEERAAALELEQAKNKAAGATTVEPEKKDERPKADINLIADIGSARSNKKNLFKRRTKQVYFADEEKRRLDIEEARPWVLEDDDEKEVWTGSLEGGQNSSYVMFVLADDGFKVVPVDRWYKFTPKLKYKTLTLDEAEEELRRAQKAETHDRWIMHKRMPALGERAEKEAADAAGAAGKASSSSGGGAGAGGSSSLKSRSGLVEYEVNDIFADDDDDDGARKRQRSADKGKHADVDEFAYELEFDDDEELDDVRFEYNEAEANEKKEQQRNANRTNYESDLEMDDDGDQEPVDDAETRALKKLMRKREGNVDYDSDKEENPYASESEVDSDEEEDEASKAAKQDAQSDKSGQQATSNTAGASSDQQQSKGTAAASGSSQPNASTKHASSSPAPAPAATKKRKRVSIAPSSTANEKAARAKAPAAAAATHHGSSSPAASGGSSSAAAGTSSDLITKQEIIDLIKSGVNNTRDLINCVRKKLRANPENKALIQNIVKEVATLKPGKGLVLKRP